LIDEWIVRRNVPFDILESLMKRLSVILIVAGGLMYCSIGKADITSVQFQDDGDGAITCSPYTWSGIASDLSLPVNGYQCWEPGHIVGFIDTDSTSDPTLTLDSAINNDTSFAWTAYYVNVYMSTTFTLSAADVTAPPDWTATIIQSPVYVGSPHGAYEGQIEYAIGAGGMPVEIGDELDFGYAISGFSGATLYSFTQEMMPVPEPTTFGFLATGALLLGGFLVARRRNCLS
jgi:hypothetical protein